MYTWYNGSILHTVSDKIVKADFGQGSGQYWLFNVRCHGNETSLFNCSRGALRDYSCNGNDNDVAVLCDRKYIVYRYIYW